MDDFSSFSGIDAKKMALINEFGRLSRGKSNQEILPLLLAISNKARSLGINFTKDETSQIIDTMLKNSSPEQQRQIKMLLELMNKK